MDRSRLGGVLAACGMALVTTAPGARADDWPQFRRDERRTAASFDRLQLPLTDIWSAPGSSVVTWKGRVFYVGAQGEKDALVCADQRTGVVRWRRALSSRWRDPALRDRRGPVAVSPDGVVFVTDGTPGSSFGGAVASQNVRISYGKSAEHAILAFRATDGAPIARFPSVLDRNPVPQLMLFDGPGGQRTRPVDRGTQPLGALLLQGNAVTASTLWDCIWSWSPGSPGRIVSLTHAFPRELTIAQRASGDPVLPELIDGIQHGWVTAACGSGIVVGSGFGPSGAVVERQTLALISGDRCIWHRDYPWGLGVPTVDQGLILTGAGGGNGMSAIVAHESATGAIRWSFPPNGPGPDTVVQMSAMSVASSTAGSQIAGGSGRTFAANAATHQRNPGLVASGGRVYGAAGGAVVALEVSSGKLVWSQPLGPGEIVSSFVASPEHLLVSTHRRVGKETLDRLIALKLESGKATWALRLPRAGALALSDGLLFSTDTETHCLAPAERIFRVAVDSPRREDYDPVQVPPAEEGAPPAAAADAAKKPQAVADASILRLHWGEPAADLLRKVRERRELLAGMPLLISLDWLDSSRAAIRGSQSGWDAKQTAAFAQLCERLAREGNPEYFDVAPEVNVYLARDFNRLEVVRALVRGAKAAVARGCPTTKVLASFNREVMGGYGRGGYLPFGRVAVPRRSQQAEMLALFADVDAVGLTSCPQSAFTSPTEIPGDYFLGLKPLFNQRPLLITGLTALFDPDSKTPEVEQASYLRHLVQCCYWLEAQLVAYPDIARGETMKPPVPDLALRTGDQERLALAMWRDTWTWKRVAQLSASAANLDSAH